MAENRDPAPTERVVLGRYRLVERIGLGGMAEVWRAHDVRLDREVAVKLLHPHLLPDQHSRERLQAEALAAARLSHPGIVAVYDVDARGEVPAIVLELVEGESLAHRLEAAGTLPEREAATIAAQVADALQHAHDRGLVHRDVKPANIVLTTDGRARLVDFGIARSLQEGAARVTATGMIIGTLRYLAPEQLVGGEASPASDVYALGAVLYEMLSGRPPHDSSNPIALVAAQKAPPPALTEISGRLADLTAGALSAEPPLRPASAGRVAAELRAWLASGDPTDEPAIDGLGPAVVALPGAAVLGVSPLVGLAAVPARADAATEARPAAAASVVTPAAVVAPPRGRRGVAAALVAIAGGVLGLAVVLGVIGPAIQQAGGGAPGASVESTAVPSQAAEATPPPAEEEAEDRGRGRDQDRGNSGRGNEGNGGDKDDDD